MTDSASQLDAPPRETAAVVPSLPPERSPLREMLAIAAPTVATMTSYTLMQFVDKLIVSRIDPDPIYVGAQGDGGIAAFIPISLAMGTLQIVNTYVSQNLGAKRAERAPAYAWNAIWLAIAWAVLLVPYAFALPSLFTWIGRTPRQVELASSYGQILVLGAVFTMCTRAIAQFFYGMHKANIVFLAGLVSNIINLALTYALVFGVWGFPQLGIAGSAIGTVIATAVELTIPLALFLGPRYNALYRTRSAWRPSLRHIKDLVRLGWPGGAMFGNEMLCWSYFMVYLVGHFGKLHSSAAWIAHQWMTLSFMPAVGISVAVSAAVGKCMGMGRPDLARQRAFLGLKVALVYMGLCAILFVLFRHDMIGLFIKSGTTAEDAEVLVRLGSQMLIATAAFQLFDATAMTLSGALRGAGDTILPGIVTVILAWVMIVLGGNLFVRFAPSLESIGPWIAAALYIASLCIFFLARFLSGRWQTIRLIHKSPAAH